MLRGKRILITGGAGFIGTHLTRTLAAENEVVVFDNLRRNAMQPARVDSLANVTLIRGDVLNETQLGSAMKGCSHVVHLASIAGVDTVMKNPVPTMQVILNGTGNVLEAARKQRDIERVVNFSTSEVFGSHAYNVTEGDVTSLGAVRSESLIS